MIIECYIKCSCGNGYNVFCELPISNDHTAYCNQCGKENKANYATTQTIKVFRNIKNKK